HLGEDDLPVEVARRLLPGDKILGGSARTVEGATAVQAAGADYLGVGAMYSTPTKETAEVVGPERLRRIKQAITVPVVAIGGINRDNAAAVVAAGADAVAVISAVLGADNVAEATRQLVAGIEEVNGQDDR
ncbi:MAG: thiamine phosphate synthase, partial [Dehalococcoidales bacterium]